MQHKSGIYKITCTSNNKIYIGQSINVDDRKKEHIYKLRNNKHDNQYLQNAYNKYGEENFEFEVIMYCNKESLDGLELLYITAYQSLDKSKGFNLQSGGKHYYNMRLDSKLLMSKSKNSTG